MKIGIFGGSFNPPHKMHEEIAKKLIENHEVDTIIFVPTGMKYEYKNNLIENKYRLDMLKIITKNHKDYQVSDFELKEEAVYTYQTLDHFQKIYPNDELFFICGADNLSYIEKWKNAEYLINTYKFLVIVRNTNTINELLEKNKDHLDHIIVSSITPSPISSTVVRELIREKKYEEAKEYVSKEVLDYIIKNHLYEESV